MLLEVLSEEGEDNRGIAAKGGLLDRLLEEVGTGHDSVGGAAGMEQSKIQLDKQGMGCSYGKAPERVRRTPSQRPGPLGVGWSHMAMILALLPCAFGLRVTAVSRWGSPSMQILSASPASAQHVLHRETKHLVTQESVIRAPFCRASPPSRTSGSTALNPDNARSPDQVLDGGRKTQAPGPEPARGSAAGAPGHRQSIRVGNEVTWWYVLPQSVPQASGPQLRPDQGAPPPQEIRYPPGGFEFGEAARLLRPRRRELPEPVRVVKPETMALIDEQPVRVEESNLLWFAIITELLLNLVLSLRFSSDYIDNLKGLISNRNVVTRKGANRVAAICTATQELQLTLQLALLTAVVRQILSYRVSLQILLQGISLLIHFKIRMSFSGGFVPFKPGNAGAARPAVVSQPAGASNPALTHTEISGKIIVDKLEQQAKKQLSELLKDGRITTTYYFAGTALELRKDDRSRGSASLRNDGLTRNITFTVATGTTTVQILGYLAAIDPNMNIGDIARHTTVEEPLPTTTGAVGRTTRGTVRGILITPLLESFIDNGGPSVANVPDMMYFGDVADAFSVRYLIPAEGRPTIAALYLLFAGNVSHIQSVLYQRYLQLLNDHGIAVQARGVRLGDVAFRGDDRRLTKLQGDEIPHLDVLCATSQDVNKLVRSGMAFTLQFVKPPAKPIVLQLQLPKRDEGTDQLNADLWDRKKQDADRKSTRLNSSHSSVSRMPSSA